MGSNLHLRVGSLAQSMKASVTISTPHIIIASTMTTQNILSMMEDSEEGDSLSARDVEGFEYIHRVAVTWIPKVRWTFDEIAKMSPGGA